MPGSLGSIDAVNFYDSVMHVVILLIFQAMGVGDGSIEIILTAIQEMKYFLRMAYRDSTNFVGSTIHLKFQGLCQDNGAAPAGWAVVSIVIIGPTKRRALKENLFVQYPIFAGV